MNVLLGILQKTRGKIHLFGEDLDEVHPMEVRSYCHYLSSEPLLFGSTVRECIDPDGES